MITQATSATSNGIEQLTSAGSSGSSVTLDPTAFENALTQALDQALASIGIANPNVSVSTSTSASGQQQFIVTMGSSGSSAGSGAAATTSAAPSSSSGTTAPVWTPNPATNSTGSSGSSGSGSSGSGPSNTGSSNSGASSSGASGSGSSGSAPAYWAVESTPGYLAAEKAYWTEQPAAVQQLEYAPAAERASLASTLESEGYNINVPIMVWGWNPVKTMQLLQAYGDPYDASILNEAGVS